MAELLAAANLAPTQLAQAQQQGGVDAARAGVWAGLLKALPGAAVTALDAGTAAADKEADTAATKAVAEHIGDVGAREAGPPTSTGAVPYSDTPGQAAGKATDALGQMAKGQFDPFGMKADAYSRAQAKAQTQVAQNIDANRKAAQATQRQENTDVIASADRARQRQREDREAQQGDTRAALAYLPHVVAAGIDSGDGPDVISERVASMPAFAAVPPDVLHHLVTAEHQSQSRRRFNDDDDREAARQKREDDHKNAEAQRARDYAAAKAAAAKAQQTPSPSSTPPGFQAGKDAIKKAQAARKSAADAIEEGNHILAELDKPDVAANVGPFVGRYEIAKQGLGFKSDAAGMRANLGDSFNVYKHAISGAAVTDREKPDLTKVAPDDIDDSVDNIRAKVRAGIEHAQRQIALADSILATGDIRATPAAGATVRITDGVRTKTVPLEAWQAHPVDGWRVLR